MTSIDSPVYALWFCATDLMSSSIRGKYDNSSGEFVSRQSLPDDPSGTHILTLTNVIIGSRIAIRDQANTTTLYDQIAATSSVDIPLDVYAPGSPLNNWRIDIRQGSNFPYYQRYKTFMTATPGASSLFINQLPDQR